MRTAKSTLLVSLITVLSVGLVYSQLCNTVCAFYGCSPSGVVRNLVPDDANTAAGEENKSECGKHNQAGHQGNKEQGHTNPGDPPSVPLNPGNSHQSEGCPAHADQTALMSAATTSSCAATHLNPKPVDGEFHVEDSTSFRSLAGVSFIIKPDRSPPKRTVPVLRV